MRYVFVSPLPVKATRPAVNRRHASCPCTEMDSTVGWSILAWALLDVLLWLIVGLLALIVLCVFLRGACAYLIDSLKRH